MYAATTLTEKVPDNTIISTDSSYEEKRFGVRANMLISPPEKFKILNLTLIEGFK